MTIHKLWKVVLTHQMGAQAPSFFVETKYVAIKTKKAYENRDAEYLKALTKAKLRTRLSDFPDVWSIDVIDTKRKWDSKRQKWLF
jgi:hypothetical protein